jgi:hypothetical protein
MLRKLPFSQTGPNYAVQNKTLEKANFGGYFPLSFSKGRLFWTTMRLIVIFENA